MNFAQTANKNIFLHQIFVCAIAHASTNHRHQERKEHEHRGSMRDV